MGSSIRKKRVRLLCGHAHGRYCREKCIFDQYPGADPVFPKCVFQILVRRHQPSTLLSSGVKRLKLIPEKEYLFTHKRMRTFRAVFKRIVRAPSTDTMDEYYYECEVDANLSGNPWSRMEDRALMLLRPSLITVVQNAPTDPRSLRQIMPLGQGKRLVRTQESWVTECIHSIRSVLRNLKRI